MPRWRTCLPEGGIGRPAYRQAGALESNTTLENIEEKNAQVAELVDALVSNTNEVTLVPVRLRLWVRKLAEKRAFLFLKLYFMKAFFVYAIKSTHRNYIYVGLTDNPERRMIQHNKGYNKTTKPYAPFLLIYLEKVGSREDARKREKYLKSGVGKEFLKEMI